LAEIASDFRGVSGNVSVDARQKRGRGGAVLTDSAATLRYAEGYLAVFAG